MSPRTPGVTPFGIPSDPSETGIPIPAPALRPRVLLSIAGFDPCNGAGVTADLQTFAAHGFFGTSVVTALTAQSTLGVATVHPVPADFLRQSIETLTADLAPAGIKIGMLGSQPAASTVSSFLQAYLEGQQAKQHIPIVLDPVLHSSSGRELYRLKDVSFLHTALIPQVTWLTPNWRELSTLTGEPVRTLAQAEAAAHALGARHPHLHVVVTAGDHAHPTDLLRLSTGAVHHFPGKHIPTRSTHGTGCAFSSALLCHLLLTADPVTAVRSAKNFVAEALRCAPALGHGHGPLNLLWPLQA